MDLELPPMNSILDKRAMEEPEETEATKVKALGAKLASPESLATLDGMEQYESALGKIERAVRRVLRSRLTNMLVELAVANAITPKRKASSSRDIEEFIDAATGPQLEDALKDALKKPIGDAASIGLRVGAEELLEQVGVNVDLLDDKVLAALERQVQSMLNKVAKEVSKRTRESLRLLANESADAETLHAAVTDYMEGTSTADGIDARARMVARTEAARAFNEGSVATFETAGIKMKRWKTNAGACEFCRAVKRERPTVGVREKFYNQGHVLKGVKGGTMTLDYEAISSPPLHPNCRCYLAPSR